MTFEYGAILFVISGGFFFAAFFILSIFARRRFLGEFWGRLRQSHIFTIVQLLGTGSFWAGAGCFAVAFTCIYLGVLGLQNSTEIGWSIMGIVIGSVMVYWICKRLVRHFAPTWSRLPIEFPANPPTFAFSTPNSDLVAELSIFVQGFKATYECLHRNLQVPFGKIKTWFAIPGSKYPAPYLWDSCFISGAWRLWDARIAQEILRPFLDLQNAGGMSPQTIVFGLVPNYNITNPPLLAFALAQASKMTGDYSLPLAYFSALQNFGDYFENHRRPQRLFQWTHSYESGLDNSPRFTNTSEKQKYDLSSLWAIDLNTWMCLHYQAMAEIAGHETTGSQAAETQHYEEKAQEIVEGLLDKLWGPEEGLFFDYDYKKEDLLRITTIASLLPLATGSLPSDILNSLVAHVEDPLEFNTPIPLPTVSRSDPLFLKDTWRGPVWVNTAWMVLFGLGLNGKDDIAGDLAYRLVKGVYETRAKCGSFYEFYDPDGPTLAGLHRKQGNFGKKITLGDKPIHNFCGWTALVNTILLENILGYARNAGVVILKPHLPAHWRDVTFHVTIPQFGEEIEMHVPSSGELTAKILVSSGKVPETGNTFYFQGQNHTELQRIN